MLLIVPPSDGVILAIIASVTTLAGQVLQMIAARRARKKDVARREELSQKVDRHSHDLKRELEVNTKLTQATSSKAEKAYCEANNYNLRLLRVEKELRDDVIAELVRLSHNIHHIANALTPLVGKTIELEGRRREN